MHLTTLGIERFSSFQGGNIFPSGHYLSNSFDLWFVPKFDRVARGLAACMTAKGRAR